MIGKAYNAVIYLRLSREDGDDETSESIVNQRNFIMDYINKHPDLHYIDEYKDDGYTGSNFDRPGWKKLLEDIEKKKINTIITKDLSRMGRDYISMGNYIEREFPEHNIRYIAINDDIDTLYETPGLDYLQFKLMFNDFFLKDTSKKIRKIMKSKKELGEYTGWKGIYGYKRDPFDKHKLIVDEEVRHVVERMFDLFKQGYGTKAIADIFTLENIPNPSTHAGLIRGKITETSAHWCSRTVAELLENPTYLGHLVQGRRKKVGYKSKKEIRIPKEDWIIVKNTHEAIIDEETFNTVQKLMRRNKNKPHGKSNYLLKGLLYCKECGHSIGVNYSSDKKRRYCVCNYYTSHSKFGVCTPHSMNYDKLERKVLDNIKEIVKKNIDTSELVSKLEETREKNDVKTKLKGQISSIDIKIRSTTNNIDKLYIDKLEGIISLDQYNRLKQKLNKEIEQLDNQKQNLINELGKIDRHERKRNKDDTLKQIKEFLSFDRPSTELLVNLIDKIEIHEDKTVEVNYKFRVN